ncbi:hypothetical protein LLEC1_02091 [Akanthomyces lecanii]|uniref:Large ribosomal subunit protein P1 n=1 Tax=Cordyceps confragosa TaxID=2714763 RepID=A0A179IA92_CORDF|nr:hypothetical protein LLEC1_02091 [Akanthomyces lecanii]
MAADWPRRCRPIKHIHSPSSGASWCRWSRAQASHRHNVARVAEPAAPRKNYSYARPLLGLEALSVGISPVCLVNFLVALARLQASEATPRPLPKPTPTDLRLWTIETFFSTFNYTSPQPTVTMSTSELASSYAALILADDGIEITADKLQALIKAANVEVEPIWTSIFAKPGTLEHETLTAFCATQALEGKDVKDLLVNEAKEEEKEESDEDMGFGLFD